MRAIFLLFGFFVSLCDYAQTISDMFSSMGLYQSVRNYSKLNDIPYSYHLEKIGHPVNFDTLIEYRLENQGFHESRADDIVLDTVGQDIYYTDQGSGNIAENFSISKNDSIHRFYRNQRIMKIVCVRSGKLYSTHSYRYSQNGEIDTLIISEGVGKQVLINDGTHIKPLKAENPVVFRDRVKRIVQVINKSQNRRYKLNYEDNIVKRIVSYNLKTGESEGIFEFNREKLLISMTSPFEEMIHKYTFDDQMRWIKKETIVNGRLFGVTIRNYISAK